MNPLFRSDLAEAGPSVINVPVRPRMMCLNESCLDPYQAIKEQFLASMEKVRLNRYLSPLTAELHQCLAAYARVEETGVVWGNGADDILYHIFLAVRENAAAYAVCLAPSYFDYGTFCRMVGLNIRYLDLEPDFSFDSEAYLRLASHPDCRLAILCNPNNPTGNLYDAEQLLRIVDALPDKLVLVDETYFEFSGATLVGELDRRPNLMLTRSFSKAFSGAGLRFGYALSAPDNIYSLRKVLTTFHTSILNQAFAYSILEHVALFQAQVAEITAARDTMYRQLSDLPGVTVHPSWTNFLTFSVGEGTPRLFEHLQEQGIAVRDVGAHRLLRGHLRVTVSCAEDNSAFLDVMSRWSI